MAKWKNISFWVLGFALVLLVSSFSKSQQKQIRVNGLDININYSTRQYFVKKADVEDIIYSEYPIFDSLPFQEINIHLLEESLDNHPSIRKAEVYSGLDGILRIDVIQKKPLARVQGSQLAFYIDERGDTMQLSPNYSAKVPLITGLTSLQQQEKVFGFLSANQQNEFYRNWFSGIHISENEEWILYPKPGNHKILLGKPDNIERKLNKLKVFYESMVSAKNLDSIKSINLKYEGQVVCQKHR